MTSPRPLPPAQSLTDPSYWHAMLPGLSFTEGRPYPPDISRAAPLTAPGPLREDVLRHGYHVGATGAPHVRALAQAAGELVRRGLDPMWLLLSDELWLLTKSYQSTFAAAFPHLRLLVDHYVFLVDPSDPGQNRGWAPHRDRPDMAFVGPDRVPEYVTIWLALTDATADNGCMYLLPGPDDPDYATQEPTKLPKDPQSVIAVPVAAGTPIFWTGRVIHWGGRAAPHCAPGALRVSVAFAAASPDYETGLFEVAAPTQLPSLEERLGLLFDRIDNYQHRVAEFTGYAALKAEYAALKRQAAEPPPRARLDLRT